MRKQLSKQLADLSPTTEALTATPGFRPGGRLTFCCQKVSKERNPTICVPALRCGQTCVTPFRLLCRPTRCAARRFAQTDGGKPVHDATLSCGSVARIPNRVPQAQINGWIRAACKNWDEAGCWSCPLCPRCPQAQPAGRGQQGPALCLLSGGPAHRRKKVSRLAGRDPLSV